MAILNRDRVRGYRTANHVMPKFEGPQSIIDMGHDRRAFFTVERTKAEGIRLNNLGPSGYQPFTAAEAYFDPSDKTWKMNNRRIDKHDSEHLYRVVDDHLILFNTVSPKHPTTTYYDIFNMFDGVFGPTCVALQLLDSGRKFVAIFETDFSLERQSPDLKHYFMLRGSYDSSYATEVYDFSMRPWCTNMISSGNRLFKVRKTLNYEFLLGSQMRMIATAQDNYASILATADQYKKISINDGQFIEVMKSVYPFPRTPDFTGLNYDQQRKVQHQYLLAVQKIEDIHTAIQYFWGDEEDTTLWSAWNAIHAYQSKFNGNNSRSEDAYITKQFEALTAPLHADLEFDRFEATPFVNRMLADASL